MDGQPENGVAGLLGKGGRIVHICGFQAAFVQLYRQPETKFSVAKTVAKQ